jgi:hypothetical protein
MGCEEGGAACCSPRHAPTAQAAVPRAHPLLRRRRRLARLLRPCLRLPRLRAARVQRGLRRGRARGALGGVALLLRREAARRGHRVLLQLAPGGRGRGRGVLQRLVTGGHASRAFSRAAAVDRRLQISEQAAPATRGRPHLRTASCCPSAPASRCAAAAAAPASDAAASDARSACSRRAASAAAASARPACARHSPCSRRSSACRRAQQRVEPCVRGHVWSQDM